MFYALMSNKSAEAYEKLFGYIEENVFKLNPTSFMADYEGGIRKMINNLYPNAILLGCWYHFKAAVRRNCGRSLLLTIADNPNAGMVYRMLLNLPLLPPNKIEEGYGIIKRIAKECILFKCFKHIFEYFENFWLRVVNIYLVLQQL